METKENQIVAKPLITTIEFIRQSWETLKARPVQLLTLELFAIIPVIVFAIIIAAVAFIALAVSGNSISSLSPESLPPAAIIVIGILMFIWTIGTAVFLFWGSAARIVFLRSGAQEPSLKPALQESWGILRGFIGVGLLQALATLGGFILLIVPGMYLMITYFFSQYAYVFEHQSGVRGVAALRRSSELTKGFWWGILSRLLVFGMLLIAAQMMLRMAVTWTNGIAVLSGSNMLAGLFSVITVIISIGVTLGLQALHSVFLFKLFDYLYRAKQESSDAFHPFSVAKRAGLIALFLLMLFVFAMTTIELNRQTQNSAESAPPVVGTNGNDAGFETLLETKTEEMIQ